MATDPPNVGAGTTGLDVAAATVSGTGARTIRSHDDRLTLLATRMVLASLTFFFACFYFAQIYLQILNQNGMWLPIGVDHPASAYGVIETGLILIAGLVYFGGQWLGLYKRNFARLTVALWIAAALTVVSVIVHVIELKNPGFTLQAGGYASVFIITEGLFTVILAVTSIVFLGIANRARLGLFTHTGVAVEAFGEYFGWISAIALINFLALYIQPFFPSGGGA